MRIPLDVIRSGGRAEWRAQFVRATVHANALDVWAYSERASSVSDATFFGTIQQIGATPKAAAAARPRPRAQIYGLGEATSHANGGDTSRLGADLALPITPTASLVASLHPDFSNVETDQITIAPQEFPRINTAKSGPSLLRRDRRSTPILRASTDRCCSILPPSRHFATGMPWKARKGP